MFDNTINILCSFPWIQGNAQENGKPSLTPKSFSTPTRARVFTGPSVLIGIIQLHSHVWLFEITCMATEETSLSFTIFCSFLKHCFHCFSMYVPWSNRTGCSYPCFFNSMYHIKAIPKKMKCKKQNGCMRMPLKLFVIT